MLKNFRQRSVNPDFSAWLPRSRLINLLKHWEYSSIIDVGSHDGSWLASVVGHLDRQSGFSMVLIDPLTEPTAENLRKLRRFGRVDFHGLALGKNRHTAILKVASNNGESSSLFDFGEAHVEAAPDVHFTEEKIVTVDSLDNVLRETENLGSKILLKIDAQGAEDIILAGGADTLQRVLVVVAEASLVDAYMEGSTLFSISSHLHDRGFKLAGLVESFSEQNFGAMIQMDAVYVQC